MTDHLAGFHSAHPILLDAIVDELLREANAIADRRHCFIEEDVTTLDGTDRRLPRIAY